MGNVFAGIKVAEFAAFAAGPGVGKMLANYGAEVVHIESRKRPDGFRVQYPPYANNEPGLDRSGCFALFNDGKMSVTLDLKAPGALSLGKRIVAWADVVIENFTPGTMERLGLDYGAVKEVNDDVIMLRSCNMGQSGPFASHPGFGFQLTSWAGFTNLAGDPGRSPVILYGPYIDFIGVGYGVVAVAAALDYRRRTGEGQMIDLAQYEAGLQFMAPSILEYGANGRIMQRQGNRSTRACPHGVYPCRGDDRWCTISAFDDGEWRRLVDTMGNPPWAVDGRWDTFSGRKAGEDELDGLIGKWTAGFTAEQLMERLQAAQVHCCLVSDMADLYVDPQLGHRRFWRRLAHSAMGDFRYQTPPFILAGAEATVDKPSPNLGQDNEHFFRDALGLSAEEYDDLVARQVIY